MTIQCPKCKARYRTRVLPEGHSALQVKCPKCAHLFLFDREAAEDNIPNLLMVDDARFFRELMRDLLQERKLNFLTADSAAEAWTMLEKEKFNLLIIDINLPDKNGLDLVKEIRQKEEFGTLPILCISGVYRKEDDAMKAIRAGADDFISKSFKPDELNERIDKLLQK